MKENYIGIRRLSLKTYNGVEKTTETAMEKMPCLNRHVFSEYSMDLVVRKDYDDGDGWCAKRF